MSKELRDQDYLEHIQDAIGKIHRYVAGKSEADFMADDLVQDGVIRNLEIIGEAVTKLSPELKSSHDDVPWGEISGMRNRLDPRLHQCEPYRSYGTPWRRCCQSSCRR